MQVLHQQEIEARSVFVEDPTARVLNVQQNSFLRGKTSISMQNHHSDTALAAMEDDISQHIEGEDAGLLAPKYTPLLPISNIQQITALPAGQKAVSTASDSVKAATAATVTPAKVLVERKNFSFEVFLLFVFTAII